MSDNWDRPKLTFKQWFTHSFVGCEFFIEEDGEVINGLWWGFCSHCGRRYAKRVDGEGKPLGPWVLT